MGVHWFDSFEPSDWIAMVAAIVSLVAIAVPTALFFFERRERKAAEAATAIAEAARETAERKRAESELANAAALLAVQQKELDRLEQIEEDRRQAAIWEPARRFHVWLGMEGRKQMIYFSNTGYAPIQSILLPFTTHWVTVKTNSLDYSRTENGSYDRVPPTGDRPLAVVWESIERYVTAEDDPEVAKPASQVTPPNVKFGFVQLHEYTFWDAYGRGWTRTRTELQRCRHPAEVDVDARVQPPLL